MCLGLGSLGRGSLLFSSESGNPIWWSLHRRTAVTSSPVVTSHHLPCTIASIGLSETLALAALGLAVGSYELEVLSSLTVSRHQPRFKGVVVTVVTLGH